MLGIGGNTVVTIQKKTTSKNVIGEAETTWVDVGTMKGWLDLQTGDSKHTSFNAKLQESSHVFITDFVQWSTITSSNELKAVNCRLVASGDVYEVMLIDDPMEMHKQIEIYLKKVGD